MSCVIFTPAASRFRAGGWSNTVLTLHDSLDLIKGQIVSFAIKPLVLVLRRVSPIIYEYLSVLTEKCRTSEPLSLVLPPLRPHLTD